MACDLKSYTDFQKSLSAAPQSTDVANPQHIFANINNSDGATELHVFTGIALVNIVSDNDDDQIRKGTIRIDLNFPLSQLASFISSTTTAGFASIFNKDDDDVIFAVDCAETGPVTIVDPVSGGEEVRLILTAALAIQGGQGDAGINRIGYEANVLLRTSEVQLQSLFVSNLEPVLPPLGSSDPTGPPEFGPNLGISEGQVWGARVILTGPASGPGVFVELSDSNLQLAPLKSSSVPVLGTQISADTGPQPAVGRPVGGATDVTVTATLGSVQKTAVVTIIPKN
jgi:hypothetical protein